MEFDIRMSVAIIVAAVSSYLMIVIVRTIFNAIDKSLGGKLYAKGWMKKIIIFLDTLLPILPCAPSGLLTMLIMYYWPPDALWNSSLLHFCIGALAGSVAAQIYQMVTRGLEKYAKRVINKTCPSDPPKKDDPVDPPPAVPS